MTWAPLNGTPPCTAITFADSWFLKMKQPENGAPKDSALCIVQLSVELVVQGLITRLAPLLTDEPETWRQ